MVWNFQRIEPIISARRCGGWLATTPNGAPISVGVTGETEAEARSAFRTAMERWEITLRSEEEEIA
jgi:hypothetical protein